LRSVWLSGLSFIYSMIQLFIKHMCGMWEAIILNLYLYYLHIF
jgi:hypothetical protein